MLEHPPDSAFREHDDPCAVDETDAKPLAQCEDGDAVHTKDAFSRLALLGNHATCWLRTAAIYKHEHHGRISRLGEL
jgi:hypothetical protein